MVQVKGFCFLEEAHDPTKRIPVLFNYKNKTKQNKQKIHLSIYVEEGIKT